MRQGTVTALITDATLEALHAILDPSQGGYLDTADPSTNASGISRTLL
jgi:hypothetical protein